jgi:hypothetical protein
VTGKARASTGDATAKRRPLARSRDADAESPDVWRTRTGSPWRDLPPGLRSLEDGRFTDPRR